MSSSLDAPAIASDVNAPPARSEPTPVLRIEPSGRWPGLGAREIWSHRGLLFFLVWRDIKVRYAQTVLGAGWALLQPVLTMVVFTLIFGRFASIPSDGVPYSVFSLAALVPWTFFSGALTGASTSLVNSANLITKVYFPRLVVPFAPVFAGLVDLAIGMCILFVFMLAYGIAPAASAILILPLLVVAMVLTAIGVGCLLAALNVQYRDVKYVTPFLVQIWMYASPIVYPLSLVPEKYRSVYALNPMVGVVEGFRSVLLQTNPIPWTPVILSVGVGAMLAAGGALYFRWIERVFADVV